jgi:membrane fusion protein (multidrug efflux system)
MPELKMYAPLSRVAAFLLAAAISPGALAQQAPQAPLAVGVVAAERRPITDQTELNGRIQAVNRVDIVARVNGFLETRFFDEGSTVKKGDLLYRIEQAPYQADLEAKSAAVAQAEAQLTNANIQLRRAEELLKSAAGSQARYDDALAAQLGAAAQLKSAQAAQRQSQINLDYTEIRSPIDGRIGRTAVTPGNVVGPGTGTLTTIVSQDPMYVVFPLPVRRGIELRERYAGKGGFDAVRVRIRLPNGKLYDQVGRLEFVDVTVSSTTDTIILRAVIPNPVVAVAGEYGRVRELTDNEFVRVILEGAEPEQVLTVPRTAVLTDQQGNFVYVVDENNVARQRRVRLGDSTPELAAVVSGLSEGERVIVEGLQRVRPNMPVAPGPATVALGRD